MKDEKEHFTIDLCDMSPLFFDVRLDKIYRTNQNGEQTVVPGYKTIVNVETDKPISIISDDYQLITNRYAYDLCEPFIKIIFKDLELSDFFCFDYYLSSTKGVCNFGLLTLKKEFLLWRGEAERYYPFIIVNNSYNKYSPFKIYMGFMREECANGCLFTRGPWLSGFSLPHTKKHKISDAYEYFKKRFKNYTNIDEYWQMFADDMNILKSEHFNQSFTIPMLIDALNLYQDKNTDELKEIDIYNIQVQLETLIDIIDRNLNTLGQNYYAFYNALTYIASHPKESGFEKRYTYNLQKRVSEWSVDITNSFRSKDNPTKKIDYYLWFYADLLRTNNSIYKHTAYCDIDFYGKKYFELKQLKEQHQQ